MASRASSFLTAAAAAAVAVVAAVVVAAAAAAAGREDGRVPPPAFFARDEINPCPGTVTLGPTRCPCDVSWEVYTRGRLANVSFSVVATVPPTGGAVGSDLLFRVRNVTAGVPIPNTAAARGDPQDYKSRTAHRRLDVAADVTVYVSLEAGAWAPGCLLAEVHAGVAPVAPACPVLDVSPAGPGGGAAAAAAAAANRQAIRAAEVGGRRSPARRGHARTANALPVRGGNGGGRRPAAAAAPVARIVGGRPVPPASGERSLLAVLLSGPDRSPFCSGTYLPPRQVLTAAHCTATANDSVRVVVPGGDPAGVVLRVAAFAAHPRYAEEGAEYAVWDFGVITLRVDEGTARRLAAAPWPRLALNGDPAAPAAGSAVRTAGFGVVVDGAPAEGAPRFVDQPALTPAQCVAWGAQRRRRGLTGWAWDRPLDHPAFLCAAVWAGGCSPCFADSGGPVYQVAPPTRGGGEPTYVQVGVTSLVYCSLPDYPSVSARLSAAKEWVDGVVGRDTGGGAGGTPAAVA